MTLDKVIPYLEDANLISQTGEKFNPHHSSATGQFSTGGSGGGTQSFGAMNNIPGLLNPVDQKETIRRWHNGIDVEGMQGSSRSLIAGKEPRSIHNATWEDRQAKFMMRQIEGGSVQPELHRGMAVKSEVLATYKKGGTFILPLSSFSKSPAVADKFANLNAKFSPGSAKVLIRAKNAKGFDLSSVGIRNQSEVVVAGKFRITKVLQEKGTTVLEIEP
jgi:hypothetical protein